jgi:hypothetical protein
MFDCKLAIGDKFSLFFKNLELSDTVSLQHLKTQNFL